jgi:hypothetical protein
MNPEAPFRTKFDDVVGFLSAVLFIAVHMDLYFLDFPSLQEDLLDFRFFQAIWLRITSTFNGLIVRTRSGVYSSSVHPQVVISGFNLPIGEPSTETYGNSKPGSNSLKSAGRLAIDDTDYKMQIEYRNWFGFLSRVLDFG